MFHYVVTVTNPDAPKATPRTYVVEDMHDESPSQHRAVIARVKKELTALWGRKFAGAQHYGVKQADSFIAT